MALRSPVATAFVVALAAVSPVVAASASGPAWQAKVDPWVLDTAHAARHTEFLVVLTEQADLSASDALPSRPAKGRFAFEMLSETARRTQGPVLASLAALGVEHRPFWVVNMIWVRGDLDTVAVLAARPDVARIHANPQVAMALPSPEREPEATQAIEPNIVHTGAPDVFWDAGFTGQEIVVAGSDTGYDWDHSALRDKYRGWNGSSADHNYQWHDAIHSGGGVCGPDSSQPCDDNGHGTHTMGIMVGDDGGSNQVGMAPGARWIGCRNMNQGVGSPATYTECFQWMIAPTDLNDQNPDPAMAPHVINNSWSCPDFEGCTDPDVLKKVVENTRAAGILVVVSAGNSGSGCETVNTPAAIYDASFSVGATDNSDLIASFSSRGPVTVDGSDRLKPDISAPGVSVRSSWVGGGYIPLSGTSMSGPHVVGLAALIMSADSCFIGDPDTTEAFVEATALPRTTTQTCGGVPGSEVPNNTYGFGAIRAVLPDPADCGGGIPCGDVQRFQARCRAVGQGNRIQARVTMLDTAHDGEQVEISVDGVPSVVTIVGQRATLLQNGAASGAHTVELTDPAGCFPAVVVNCP